MEILTAAQVTARGLPFTRFSSSAPGSALPSFLEYMNHTAEAISRGFNPCKASGMTSQDRLAPSMPREKVDRKGEKTRPFSSGNSKHPGMGVNLDLDNCFKNVAAA
jgi:hypothetical protein